MSIKCAFQYLKLYFELKVMEIKLIQLDIHRLKTITKMYTIILEMMKHKEVNERLLLDHGDLVNEFYRSFHKLEAIGSFLSSTRENSKSPCEKV